MEKIRENKRETRKAEQAKGAGKGKGKTKSKQKERSRERGGPKSAGELGSCSWLQSYWPAALPRIFASC
eukprot:1732672-Amphidinium_carterae.1